MASKPKVKQSTDWVGQIINAASYAVRADTLDSMLNQIPGLMQQNAQINAQRDFEIDKHNDAVELEKQKLVDDKLFKDTQLDYQLIGALNDPTSSPEEKHKAMVDRVKIDGDDQLENLAEMYIVQTYIEITILKK